MKKIKPQTIRWRNQKYILAHDEIPEGMQTIETYVRDVLKIKLDAVQMKTFGLMASTKHQQTDKTFPQYVKDKKYTAVRVYKKSLLDIVFMEFAQTQK
ncbi:MAG TPA: hypothetical protein PKZ43_09875 [Bacteroidales bacterium]|nr:hypothetical protein [Bacteroidales bacterium]